MAGWRERWNFDQPLITSEITHILWYELPIAGLALARRVAACTQTQTPPAQMGASAGPTTAVKRNNAQLDKSYKRATGVKDERKQPRVPPGTIVTAAFLLVRLGGHRVVKYLDLYISDFVLLSWRRDAVHWSTGDRP